jgi:hypothetical protein
MNEEERKRRALDALRRGLAAKVKQDYKPQLDELENKAENKIKDLGVEPETALKSAALLKMAADLSQGRVDQNIDGYGIEAEVTPEEKRIMLKKDWNF